MKESEDVAIVIKGGDGWRYLLKGESARVDAMKIWEDKGNGFKEILSFKDGDSHECSLPHRFTDSPFDCKYETIFTLLALFFSSSLK